MPPTNPKFVKPAAAEKHFGVDRRTLKKWVRAGHIRCLRPGDVGPWLYDIASAPRTGTDAAAAAEDAVADAVDTGDGDHRVDVIYGRVSTRKQLGHLTTQISNLQANHPGCRVFKDCASGLNFKRKGLQALLQLAAQGRVRHVHIAHKDRLCRFAYDLVEFVLKQHDTKIVVDADDDQSPEQDLADDVLSVITVFGARLYGKRSGGRRRQQAHAGGQRSDGSDGSADGSSDGSSDVGPPVGPGLEAEEAAAALPEEGGGGGPAANVQGADAAHSGPEARA